MEPKPVYSATPAQARSTNAARHVTLTVPVAMAQVVYALFAAHNQGHTEVLVRLNDWKVDQIVDKS